jgi:hypothetical protein
MRAMKVDESRKKWGGEAVGVRGKHATTIVD